MSSAWSARGTDYAACPLHKHGSSLAKLRALARPYPDDACLDIGTGAGHTAAAPAPLAAQVVGLDPSKGMLCSARKLYRNLSNLEFVLAPAHDTGLRAESFDLITARHTLLGSADAPAREVFRIEYEGAQAVRFEMPMALILALKPV